MESHGKVMELYYQISVGTLIKGLETGDTTLSNSDSSLKPFKCVIIGHARSGALVVGL